MPSQKEACNTALTLTAACMDPQGERSEELGSFPGSSPVHAHGLPDSWGRLEFFQVSSGHLPKFFLSSLLTGFLLRLIGISASGDHDIKQSPLLFSSNVTAKELFAQKALCVWSNKGNPCPCSFAGKCQAR